MLYIVFCYVIFLLWCQDFCVEQFKTVVWNGLSFKFLQKHVFFPKRGHLKMQTYQSHVLDLERRVPASYH